MALVDRLYIVIGGLLLAAAAALSAYGFHGLGESIGAAERAAWNWAVQMHSYHALGLILAGLLGHLAGGGLFVRLAGGLMLAGIVIFSGLIYAQTLGAPESLGGLVPTGGFCFMAAWVALALGMGLARPRTDRA